jgi:F-type H+-transporting ATPase subunit epsilon
MNLEILLPSRVFATLTDVSEIIVDTQHGSMGLLPQRLDCVAALVPGILTYRTAAGTVYLAVDEGVLVKTGDGVLVSVRHAIPGADLAALHENVKREFMALDEEQAVVRRAVAHMESSFIARFAGIDHAR